MKPATLPFLTAAEKQEDVLMMNEAAALMDLSEKAKRAMESLGKAMNSACHIENAASRSLEDFLEAGSGAAPVQSVKYLLCEPHYNV